MFQILAERLRQKRRTIAFPDGEPTLPDRYRGLPAIDAARCIHGCRACVEACAPEALSRPSSRPDIPASPATPSVAAEQGCAKAPTSGALSLDLGRCLLCGDCEPACPEGAIAFSRDWRMASRTRQGLVVEPGRTMELAEALDSKARALFGRSLRLRQVSAGGCNACEADVNVLTTVVFDLGRFGIQFVASPRHADGLLITGPVPRNMDLALRKTWDAVPDPRIVIAVGACAIAGGPFVGNPEIVGGADPILPVDLYIPGCPPHPIAILDGLLRLLGRIEHGERTLATPGG